MPNGNSSRRFSRSNFSSPDGALGRIRTNRTLDLHPSHPAMKPRTWLLERTNIRMALRSCRAIKHSENDELSRRLLIVGCLSSYVFLDPSEAHRILYLIPADAFDPDDLFKEPRRGAQTPLSLYGADSHTSNPNSDSSDEDTPGHYGHHHHPKLRNKPTVYVYDAAAEREAERKKELELEEAQRNALSPQLPPVIIH